MEQNLDSQFRTDERLYICSGQLSLALIALDILVVVHVSVLLFLGNALVLAVGTSVSATTFAIAAAAAIAAAELTTGACCSTCPGKTCGHFVWPKTLWEVPNLEGVTSEGCCADCVQLACYCCAGCGFSCVGVVRLANFTRLLLFSMYNVNTWFVEV